jgi:hypothetical protein
MLSNMDFYTQGLWFAALVSVLLALYLALMPKRLRGSSMLFVYLSIGFVAFLIDTLLGIIVDLFDIGAPQLSSLPEVLNYGVVPPLLAVIFLNHAVNGSKWVPVLLFTALSSLYEWSAVRVGLMRLHGWQPWMSIPVYLVIYGLVLPWAARQLGEEEKGNGSVRFGRTAR